MRYICAIHTKNPGKCKGRECQATFNTFEDLITHLAEGHRTALSRETNASTSKIDYSNYTSG